MQISSEEDINNVDQLYKEFLKGENKNEVFHTELQKNVKRRERIKAFGKVLDADESNIVKDLEKAGVKVKSVWDLTKANNDYSLAIPVLLNHLTKRHFNRTKEVIARVLGVKCAKEAAWDILLKEYEKATPDEDIKEGRDRGYKDGLGVAISILAGKKDLPVLLKLTQDKRNKGSRVFFIKKLYKAKEGFFKKAILAMEADPDLTQEIDRLQRGISENKYTGKKVSKTAGKDIFN